MNTDGNQTIEFRIPRDPNLVIPPMTRENVTAVNQTDLHPHQLLFYLHYVNITTSLPVSLHLRMRSFEPNLGYLFIYKFDQSPQLNSSIQLIDGWTLFCPEQSKTSLFLLLFARWISLSSDTSNASTVFEYFLDNEQTFGHPSLIFGLRELNDTELHHYCHNASLVPLQPPITDNEGFHFTADYELRLFTSGCYYLDENQQWKADGLRVRTSSSSFSLVDHPHLLSRWVD